MRKGKVCESAVCSVIVAFSVFVSRIFGRYVFEKGAVGNESDHLLRFGDRINFFLRCTTILEVMLLLGYRNGVRTCNSFHDSGRWAQIHREGPQVATGLRITRDVDSKGLTIRVFELEPTSGHLADGNNFAFNTDELIVVSVGGLGKFRNREGFVSRESYALAEAGPLNGNTGIVDVG